MPKFFSHNCPTINFLGMVNHFCYLEILRTGGFSAESLFKPDPDAPRELPLITQYDKHSVNVQENVRLYKQIFRLQ
jgi:hypothetical protein